MSQLLTGEHETWPGVEQFDARLSAPSRAVGVDRFGGPEMLTPRVVDTPDLHDGQVAVRVAAVGAGRTLDLRSATGTHAHVRHHRNAGVRTGSGE